MRVRLENGGSSRLPELPLKWRRSLALLSLLVLMGGLAQPKAPASGMASPPTARPDVEPRQGQQPVAAYGKLPLHFVANAGQVDARVRYYAQAPGCGVYFTKEEAVFAFAQRSPARERKGLVRTVSLGTEPAAPEEGTTRGVALGLTFLGGNPSPPRETPLSRHSGGGTSNAFLVRLLPGGTKVSGSTVDYSTFLGGSGADFGNGIAVDGSGRIYVTGTTFSPDFPDTLGGKRQGPSDAFVAKFFFPVLAVIDKW